jgi:hypothetical protein
MVLVNSRLKGACGYEARMQKDLGGVILIWTGLGHVILGVPLSPPRYVAEVWIRYMLKQMTMRWCY